MRRSPELTISERPLSGIRYFSTYLLLFVLAVREDKIGYANKLAF